MTEKRIISSSKKASLVDDGRRGFFKKAATGTAIITTVSSRPVWAGVCSLSGQLSGNLSHDHHPASDCAANGISPGGFINGVATGTGNNIDLWSYWLQPFAKTQTIHTLMAVSDGDLELLYPSVNGVSGFSGFTIEEALKPLNRSGLPINNNQKGSLRQAVCAALNAHLWEKMATAAALGLEYPVGLNEDIASGPATGNGFYINFTLAKVREYFKLGYNFEGLDGEVVEVRVAGELLMTYVQDIN